FRSNTDTLNLDGVGLQADHRGNLKVDDHYRTAVDNICAVGDVIGWPSLASASLGQGRSVSSGIVGGECPVVEDVPTGIYTLPEISSVGKTETELTAARVPYEVRSEEHTSELQSRENLVCRLLLEKKNNKRDKAKD